MVQTPIQSATVQPTPAMKVEEDYEANILSPDCYDEVPEGMEEVDGELVEKTYMTIQHGNAQANLSAEWRGYSRASQQKGKAYVEVLCRTQSQKRRPDVAYVTEELHQEYGQPTTFPQSFPLIGEIASPDDSAERLFEKAYEYLASGAEEVWILLPEAKLAFIVVAEQVLAFSGEQEIATQKVLKGFAIALSELFA